MELSSVLRRVRAMIAMSEVLIAEGATGNEEREVAAPREYAKTLALMG